MDGLFVRERANQSTGCEGLLMTLNSLSFRAQREIFTTDNRCAVIARWIPLGNKRVEESWRWIPLGNKGGRWDHPLTHDREPGKRFPNGGNYLVLTCFLF